MKEEVFKRNTRDEVKAIAEWGVEEDEDEKENKRRQKYLR